MSGGAFLEHLAALLASDGAGQALVWWLALMALGLAFLPVSRRLLPGSADAGYAAGKLLALWLAAWIAWLVGFVVPGGLSLTALAAAGAGVAGLAALAWLRAGRERSGARLPWRAVATLECAFALAFFGFAVVRSLEPTLATTEKFMDHAFVSAILNAPALPPPDPWYAGETINYYYFGHFVTAFWIRVTGAAPAVGYNLMLATLFAATATTAGSLAFEAVRLRRTPAASGPAWLAGALTAGLLVAGGNLHPALFGGVEGYHYADATRFVGYAPQTGDKLITEFPAFSFVLADLHAHLLNLPLTLVSLQLLLSLLRDGRAPWGRGLRVAGLPVARLAVLGLLLGCFWMTNSWDAPLHAGLLGLALLLRADAGSAGRAWLRAGVATAAGIGVGALVSLPFTLHFTPFGRGLSWVDTRTPLLALGILYGWQLAAALVWLALGRARPRPDDLDRFLLVLLSGALACIAAHEIVHVVDGLPAEYRRANTVFKLGFQAFTLLTVATGPMLVASGLALRGRGARLAFACVGLLLVLPPLRFAPLAGGALLASPLRDRATLDGLAQTFARNPGDAALAHWLDLHGRGQGNLLECHGASFGYGARMSVFTGIPSVMGWVSHEALWRPFEPVNLRRQAVEAAYTSGDTDRVRGVLERYEVGFVVVGELERLVFPGLDEAPFRELGEVVASHGQSRLYRIPRHDDGGVAQ